ncbi:LysR family transcriptional regulator [Burkholderia cepacia]|uniref:LysR family transcriptional regulator n=1 Tax=Burkholderia cepacia TaxID=292 RepID=UPI001CF3F9A8|nr:LysR family transcriptional regulator [Burkholderia cepacia]MCA7980444.1 LysR family transcriptional regulator [Burkholderia cepacia]
MSARGISHESPLLPRHPFIRDVMNLFSTDLNLLVVLERIYAQQSITRAAQQLSLSQSAVSHALNRLRELLGDPLFERHGNAMMPTPFTRAIIARVRNGLHTLECTLHEASRFDVATTIRRFTIGILNAQEPVVLPAIAQYVAQHAPSIDITAVQHDRRAIEADLLTGSLDAVIDVLLPHPQSVRSTRLSTDRYVVLCRRNHPRVGQRLDLDAYLAEEHVLVTSRQRGGGVEDAALVRLGAERRMPRRQPDRPAADHAGAVRAAAQRDVRQPDARMPVRRVDRYLSLLARECRCRSREWLAASATGRHIRSRSRGHGEPPVMRCLAGRSLTRAARAAGSSPSWSSAVRR